MYYDLYYLQKKNKNMKVFVTNVTEYTGPGLVQVLTEKGYKVICHDCSFADIEVKKSFEEKHKVTCLLAQKPEDILIELRSFGHIKRYILNDIHPNTPKPYEEISTSEFRSAFESLVEFPFELTKLLIPSLKQDGSGHILFMTSARQLKPEIGFSVATTVRSAATALALSLANEVARYNIQVNVIQPNYLYSEMYYPKAHFVESEEGREEIAKQVPIGRLGKPEELGELAELFISGRSTFTTGQVINFTGGWS